MLVKLCSDLLTYVPDLSNDFFHFNQFTGLNDYNDS